MARARSARTAGGTATLAAAVALVLASAAAVAAQPPVPSPLPVDMICNTLMGLNTLQYNPQLCAAVNLFVTALVNTPQDTCANTTASGFGKQLEPPALSAADLPKPSANKPAPMPLKGKGPTEYKSSQLKKLLEMEGATYNWLFAAVRNIKHFWPCSKQMGGSLDGYLVPKGWEPVGGTKAPGGGAVLEPGIYNLPQADNVSYPIMAVLKQKASAAPSKNVRQMVVLVRGTNTRQEWILDMKYDRVSWKPQGGAARAFAGEPFAGNSFSGPNWAGETHKGFTMIFDELWPQLQAALKAEVVNADKAAAPTSITFAGHSLGAAISPLLALATKYYLKANKKGSVSVGLVTFGGPSFANAALLKSLQSNVLTRRIAFVNDLVTILPCTTPPKPPAGFGESFAMPACTTGLVQTPNPDPSKWWWRDYGMSSGAVLIKSGDMPAQQAQWTATRNVYWQAGQEAQFVKTNFAAHVCSYNCFLWKYSAHAPGEVDQCIIDGAAADGHGVCPWEGNST